jgi:hypothetical protein
MSWDGTLIEDLGPRKETTPVQNKQANVVVRDEPKVVIQQPVMQQAAVSQPLQQAQTKKDEAKPGAVLKMLVSLYSYDKTEDNELTFGEGETIALLEENDSGWWKGRLERTGEEGLFPSNFVEEQGRPASSVADGPAPINARFKSLYDYDAEDNTEISIKENDILFVENEKDGWYYGYREANPSQKGNFPSNFVERC